MKQITFKYNCLISLEEFLLTMQLCHYRLDAKEKHLTCTYEDDYIFAVAEKYGFEIVEDKSNDKIDYVAKR